MSISLKTKFNPVVIFACDILIYFTVFLRTWNLVHLLTAKYLLSCCQIFVNLNWIFWFARKESTANHLYIDYLFYFVASKSRKEKSKSIKCFIFYIIIIIGKKYLFSAMVNLTLIESSVLVTFFNFFCLLQTFT